MRITFLGNFGVEYSSETHHKKSLEALGHEVIALQETQASSESVLEESMKSDMFVWVHTHGWDTPGVLSMESVLQFLKKANVPSVTYHLDLWLGLQRESDLHKDPVYRHIQHFFTADKQMAEWFNNNTDVKGHYLPAGVFHEEARLEESREKVNDVIFVGSRGYHPEWPYRKELIDWLKKTYKNRFRHIGGDGEGVIRGEALTDLYNSTKVVIGDSLVKDFNYPYYWSDRLYETVGRGGFIIFPYIKGLEDEFDINMASDNCELVTYEFGEWGQLKDKIDWFLSEEGQPELESIRRRGFEKVKNDYTYKHRWQTLIDEVFGEKA
jgi:hypothetical protein